VGQLNMQDYKSGKYAEISKHGKKTREHAKQVFLSQLFTRSD